jgi:2-polyprenyl-3-methyl-5-hydroxy-6-metoxy-1,4-benzoquinol methylase
MRHGGETERGRWRIRAEANKTQAGVHNVAFHDARSDALPADASFDLITTFDCIHDMAHPEMVISAVRKALKSDGTWDGST